MPLVYTQQEWNDLTALYQTAMATRTRADIGAYYDFLATPVLSGQRSAYAELAKAVVDDSFVGGQMGNDFLLNKLQENGYPGYQMGVAQTPQMLAISVGLMERDYLAREGHWTTSGRNGNVRLAWHEVRDYHGDAFHNVAGVGATSQDALRAWTAFVPLSKKSPEFHLYTHRIQTILDEY